MPGVEFPSSSRDVRDPDIRLGCIAAVEADDGGFQRLQPSLWLCGVNQKQRGRVYLLPDSQFMPAGPNNLPFVVPPSSIFLFATVFG